MDHDSSPAVRIDLARSHVRDDKNILHIGDFRVPDGAAPGRHGFHALPWPAHRKPSPVLVVALTAEQRSLQALRRIEHEYSLATELDEAWAAIHIDVRNLSGSHWNNLFL